MPLKDMIYLNLLDFYQIQNKIKKSLQGLQMLGDLFKRMILFCSNHKVEDFQNYEEQRSEFGQKHPSEKIHEV